MSLELNPDLYKELKKYNIPRDEGILYLMSLYYGLRTDYIPETIKKQVNVSKIVERIYYTNKPNEVKWNIALFKGQTVEFDWVKEWREPFRTANLDRAGDLKTCKERMAKMFKEYNFLTPELAIEARDLYFSGITDSQFIKKSHKFIYEHTDGNRSSMLVQYAEEVLEAHRSMELHKVL